MNIAFMEYKLNIKIVNTPRFYLSQRAAILLFAVDNDITVAPR